MLFITCGSAVSGVDLPCRSTTLQGRCLGLGRVLSFELIKLEIGGGAKILGALLLKKLPDLTIF